MRTSSLTNEANDFFKADPSLCHCKTFERSRAMQICPEASGKYSRDGRSESEEAADRVDRGRKVLSVQRMGERL